MLSFCQWINMVYWKCYICHIHQMWHPAIFISFVSLIEAPRGSHFRSHQELKGVVHDKLTQQPKNFQYREIYAKVEPWRKCVKLDGDYIKNMLLCCICFYYRSLSIIFLVFICMTFVYIPVMLSLKMSAIETFWIVSKYLITKCTLLVILFIEFK